MLEMFEIYSEGRLDLMAKIIGINLGTTNSCVAVLEGGDPKVIANDWPGFGDGFAGDELLADQAHGHVDALADHRLAGLADDAADEEVRPASLWC